MNIRQPLRAGSFYEASASSCRHHANKLLDAAEPGEGLPTALYGGLVPHAGWVYSGPLAARTLKLLDESGPLETIVLLGADHTGSSTGGEVYDSGVWRTPLGDASIDEPLARKLIASHESIRANPQAHTYEHSVEVQVPILQAIRQDIKIVPITVAPKDAAPEIGKAIGEVLRQDDRNIRVVGSTDLTHHGGHFGSPGGEGLVGVEWSADNDRRIIDLITKMADDRIIPEVVARQNACGAGAIAATIAACREMGATRGYCLQYTNSYEVMRSMYGESRDYTTVGYAAVVFG